MKTIIYLLFLSISWMWSGAIFAQNTVDSVTFQLESEIPFAGLGTPQSVLPDKNGAPYCYIAAKQGGLRIFNITDINAPLLVKTIPVADLEDEEVMNIWQEDNLLYLALGNFFGNNGQKPGLAIIDVSDPAAPVIKDVWQWDIKDRGSAFVAVSGDYAYLAAMSQGLIILNIANPDTIQFVSQIVPDPDFPLPDPPPAQVPNARGLAIKDDVAFLCYDAGGLRVINIADKANPKETGRYINATPFVPAGKQQAFNNVVLDGNTAYVSVDYCGMEVLDISDTAHIQQKAWWNPWQCQSISNIWIGSPGHTNQISLDIANHFIFLSSAQSELSVLDVSVPTQPVLIGSYGSVDNQSGTWGMTLEDHRVYLAYIVAVIPFVSNWAGVKILDWGILSGVGEVAEISSFQIYPNPFDEWVQIDLELKKGTDLCLQMFDIQGKMVNSVTKDYYSAGDHRIKVEGATLPEGLYLFRLTTADRSVVKKVMKHCIKG